MSKKNSSDTIWNRTRNLQHLNHCATSLNMDTPISFAQKKRAEGSDPFWGAEGVPGAEMYKRMSVQYGNSVVSWSIPCIVLTLPLRTRLFGTLKEAFRDRRFNTDQLLNVTAHVRLVCQFKTFYSEDIKQIVR